jgi:hypothetical protein
MIVCDDRKRVTYYYAGWPGSTHDNRVFQNSRLFLNKNKYFNHLEYLLGDSAYSISTIMVQAFKKRMKTSHLPTDEKRFNTELAKVRIASEHCIGILKGRFQCLKRNNIQLKGGKKEVKQLVDLIGACIVIHNLLINYNEDEIPREWYEKIKDDIDWTEYDENEDYISQQYQESGNRRDTVFQSFLRNYF